MITTGTDRRLARSHGEQRATQGDAMGSTLASTARVRWTGTRRGSRYTALAVGSTIAAGMLLAGCGGATDQTATTGGSGTASGSADKLTADQAGAVQPQAAAVPAAPSTDMSTGQTAGHDGLANLNLGRKVIQTASLTVETHDVNGATVKAEQLADHYGGYVSNASLTTDPSTSTGASKAASQVTLQIPAAHFSEALSALSALGHVTADDRNAVDVTAKVADVKSRVSSALASLHRIRQLLARAQTLGQVVSLESELSRREADLESVQAQQRALAAQTTLSSVQVFFEAPAVAQPLKASGFLGGLHRGWHAFTTASTAALATVGFVIPWLILALIVGVPMYAWRQRRRQPLSGLSI
jgi:hypothetical protein